MKKSKSNNVVQGIHMPLWLVKKAKVKAKKEDISLSKYVARLIKKDLAVDFLEVAND